MLSHITKLIFLIILGISFTVAQNIVNVPSDTDGEGNLNTAVETVKNEGNLSNTIFMLEAGGYYVLNGPITVPEGQTLRIHAPEPGNTQETCPPQILWTASGGVTRNEMFTVNGHIELKNVWLFYGDQAGNQVGSTVNLSDDPISSAQNAYFENVIFDYSPSPSNAAGAVTITTPKLRVYFKNCYFRNCIDEHLRYYGRALSYPYQSSGFHIDTVVFENCTFANMGYVLMQEGGEYADYVKFNHCTFLNIVMFPLQSGWWNKLIVTNSIFANCWMFGYLPAQVGEDGEVNGGTFRIDSVASFGFQVPFTDQDRKILFTNSSYHYDQWLLDWMENSPYSLTKKRNRLNDEVPKPMPMLSNNTLIFFDGVDENGNKLFPYIKRRNLYNGSNPLFINPPTDTALVKDYLNRKWDDNSDVNWAWKPMNGIQQVWPLEENLAYTNDTLKTAGLGGFPLGDLYRWWPAEYQQWLAQADAENQYLANELETPVSVNKLSISTPSQFELKQNYPNPFNPVTNIEYSVPQRSKVTLKVYNMLGQEIATLYNGILDAGTYRSIFNGSSLPSGVYFYQLKTDNTTLTKKFMLMK